MKRSSTLLCTLAVVILTVFLLATDARAEVIASGDCNETIHWSLEHSGRLTISGTGEMPNYDAWYYYDSDYTSDYTEISTPWFKNRWGITEVIIEEGITYIGNYAFSSCQNITNASIPNSVTNIGQEAFTYCTSLTSITLPQADVFEYAFEGCPIETLIFADGVETITPNMLICKDTIKNIVIPNSVTWITTYSEEPVFRCLSNLQYNTFDNARYLGNESNPYLVLVEAISPDITECTIHDQAKIIADSSFSLCNNLTALTIPPSITHINKSAFYYFYNDDVKLTDIYITDPVAWMKISGIKNLFCPPQYGSPTYKLHILDKSGKEVNKLVLDDSVTEIIDYAFINCTSITSISIPKNVTTIGTGAFLGCTALTEINISDNVTTIGTDAFLGCTSLTNIHIPDKVESIGYSAFRDCTKLSEFTIPNSVTTIGGSAFFGCTGLSVLVIPDTVTTLGDCALYGCTGLTSVTLGKGITELTSEVFLGCNNLTSIIIPNSVTHIGWSAFKDCTRLTQIIIPKSVEKINSNAFSGCANLKTVYYGGNQTQLSMLGIESGNASFRNATMVLEYTDTTFPEPTRPSGNPITKPTSAPTTQPSAKPTTKPTSAPTVKPTTAPTTKSTQKATAEPSKKPTVALSESTNVTILPSAEATVMTTLAPTLSPITQTTLASKSPTDTSIEGNSFPATIIIIFAITIVATSAASCAITYFILKKKTK